MHKVYFVLNIFHDPVWGLNTDDNACLNPKGNRVWRANHRMTIQEMFCGTIHYYSCVCHIISVLDMILFHSISIERYILYTWPDQWHHFTWWVKHKFWIPWNNYVLFLGWGTHFHICAIPFHIINLHICN